MTDATRDPETPENPQEREDALRRLFVETGYGDVADIAVEPPTTMVVERHHWINTIVGILDGAWHLTEEEQFQTIRIVSSLLDFLEIPGRGQPVEIPIDLVMEVAGSFYSIQLNSPRDSGVIRPVRRELPGDIIVPIEVWRTALCNIFTTAYPSLDGAERMGLAKIVSDLLVAIGVGVRAPAYLPDDVVRAARNP